MLYSSRKEKHQPPTLSKVPTISEFEDYINKLQKMYSKFLKAQKEGEGSSGKKLVRRSDSISAVNIVPEEFFHDEFKLKTDFFKLKSK